MPNNMLCVSCITSVYVVLSSKGVKTTKADTLKCHDNNTLQKQGSCFDYIFGHLNFLNLCTKTNIWDCFISHICLCHNNKVA